MSNLYIGLMSGTSADGIDAALVDFSGPKPVLAASGYTPYSTVLREKILALCQAGENEIQRLGELDNMLGNEFAAAVNELLKQAGTARETIQAIGSHGQTIRHVPHGRHPFTMQIGDPNRIAAQTGIITIADFRRKDMAYNGQGAPLVPAFHQYLFSCFNHETAVVNIGGISNITVLAKNQPAAGFDIGPGNVLLDAWAHLHLQTNYDDNGQWAAQGTLQPDLLNILLEDPFFKLKPPKSTGREYFNLDWLNAYLRKFEKAFAPVDIQTTLAELTARSIITAVSQHLASGEVLICGGGAHNSYLMQRLQILGKPQFDAVSIQKHGLDPDWIEAAAFAWLAKQTLHQQTGNLPKVTGAEKAAVLGGIYYP